MRPIEACPCGTGEAFDRCCLARHRGESPAATAEQQMRARYSAYAVGDGGYLWRTWHPRTRPADVTPDRRLCWLGLEILDTVAGGAADDAGEVEFRARYRVGARVGMLHERSRFAVRAGRWFYVGGDVLD